MIVDSSTIEPICAGCGSYPCNLTRGDTCPTAAGIATASQTGLVAIERYLTNQIHRLEDVRDEVRDRIGRE